MEVRRLSSTAGCQTRFRGQVHRQPCPFELASLHLLVPFSDESSARGFKPGVMSVFNVKQGTGGKQRVTTSVNVT